MNSIQEKLQDINAGIDYHVTASAINDKSKPVDTSLKGRLIPAALAGLGTLAATTTIPKYLFKTKIYPGIVAAATAGVGAAGYFAPDIYNTVLEAKRGNISKEEAKNIINSFNSINSRLGKKTSEVVSNYKELTKKATITGTIFRGANAAINTGRKAIVGGARLWAHGMAPVKKEIAFGGRSVYNNQTPIGTRVFGYATKGLTFGGIGAGAVVAHNKFTKPESGSNYNTVLRNNVLNGNIKTNELSATDSESVRKLGLR